MSITTIAFGDVGTTIETYICTAPEAFLRCSNMGTIIGGRIQMEFNPIAPSATHSIVRSDQGALERAFAGISTTFTIEAYDSYGNRQTGDGYNFVASLRHLDSPADRPRIVPANIFYRAGDGTTGRGGSIYIAEFTAEVQGRYSLSVTRQGKQLQNDQGIRGPFEPLLVEPGVPSGERTKVVHEEGTRQVLVDNVMVTEPVLIAYAGVQTVFSIEAHDVYGNRIRVGGESFIITLGLLEEGQYVDNNDGTYQGVYTLESSGMFDLRIRNDKEIISNPLEFFDTAKQAFRLNVIPSAMDPLKSSVYGSGMLGVSAGYLGVFYMQSVDTYGNLIPFGGQVITADFEQTYFVPEGKSIDEAKGLVLDADVGPGSYEVYTPTRPRPRTHMYAQGQTAE